MSLFRAQLIKCFMTLQPNTLIFLLKKNGKSFTFLQQKYWHIREIYIRHFNENINDVVKFWTTRPWSRSLTSFWKEKKHLITRALDKREYFSVSTRACNLPFDPVKSSVDATEVSQCVFHDATKLTPLKCLKNPVNTQLSVKCTWDISVLKYIYRYYQILHPITLF